MALLFWPFMIASLLLSILSISRRKPLLLVLSSILIVPMSLYLAATPRFEFWGLIFPFFYLGAALSLSKSKIWLAVLLVVPVFILIGWIGFSVLDQ
ncbi:hypothetical protein [Bacillus sinesaloumensis]|uniref:hypothetical protein n=1 Tax=Litchfieldia sinesaloumensis TaxID=1926280 RepID=UPI0009886C54|nr:hypothetical protein [Bacillus sinesaloumensis]